MHCNSLRKQPQWGISVIFSTLMAIATISLITACSPTPTAAENAAQTQVVVDQAVAEAKKEMIAEREQQDAEAAAKILEKNNRDAAVANAVANERKKVAAEQRAASAKTERRAEQRASASRSNDYPTSSTRENAYICNSCGVVQSVNVIDAEGDGSGLGVIAGGVVGGVLGNQVGGGTGRDLATIAGVVGGAYAGNKIEKSSKKTRSYNIVVKMDTGEERTFNQSNAPDVISGDKVKIENNVIIRR